MAIPPCEMKSKFTAIEIKKLSQRLNNNKASGPDQLNAEYIKHALLPIFEEIAEIYNETAATGNFPPAPIHSLLLPIPKLGKEKISL